MIYGWGTSYILSQIVDQPCKLYAWLAGETQLFIVVGSLFLFAYPIFKVMGSDTQSHIWFFLQWSAQCWLRFSHN
jgi:hypothetical protein